MASDQSESSSNGSASKSASTPSRSSMLSSSGPASSGGHSKSGNSSKSASSRSSGLSSSGSESGSESKSQSQSKSESTSKSQSESRSQSISEPSGSDSGPCTSGDQKFVDSTKKWKLKIKNNTQHYSGGGEIETIDFTWEADVKKCCSGVWKAGKKEKKYTHTVDPDQQVLVTTASGVLPLDLSSIAFDVPALIGLITEWFTGQIFNTVYFIGQVDQTNYKKIVKKVAGEQAPSLPTDGNWVNDPCP